MEKLEILNNLHELIYLTTVEFIKKNNLSIKSISFDSDEMNICENSFPEQFNIKECIYKFKNNYLNKD